jgi:hypothetical protein
MPFRTVFLKRAEAIVRSPITLLAVSFLVGMTIGLVVLGWAVWPIQYVDTTPEMLRSDVQVDYLRMAVDSFAVNLDTNTARSRFDQLGLRKWDTLDALRRESAVDPVRTDPARLKNFEELIASTTIADIGDTGAAAEPGFQVVPGDILPLVIILGIVIALASAVVIGSNIRRRRSAGEISSEGAESDLSLEAEEEAAGISTQTRSAEQAGETDEPLERFVTTYEMGNEVFEDSFTVNSPGGEFLGECGVGISEPIGVGGQKKVTAFEIWLFDRKPSRTSTVVLMSRHAFQRDDLRASLAPRGKPVLAEEGADFWLETPGLQLRVVIRDLRYGKGPLPEQSFFESLTLQMEVWAKTVKPA